MHNKASPSEDTFHLGVKALIRRANGDILLLKVNPAKLKGADDADYWDLPGGRVQKAHTILETLQREVAEETGIADIHGVQRIDMVLSNLRIPVDTETVGLILGVYQCSVNTEAITLSDEHIAYDWFAPAMAAELLAVKYPADFCGVVAELK